MVDETVVAGAAAGATGSMVCQIARLIAPAYIVVVEVCVLLCVPMITKNLPPEKQRWHALTERRR
jgi:hypothetical protein